MTGSTTPIASSAPAPAPAAAAPAPAPAAPSAPAYVPPAAVPVAAPVPTTGVGATAPAPATAPVAAPPVSDAEARLAQSQAELAKLNAYLRQNQQYVQLGQQAAAAKLTQPPAPANAAPTQPANPFGLPAFDQNLKSYIGVDSEGNEVERPGAPFGTLAAYKQYQQSLMAAIPKFFSDPMGAIGPMIEKLVAEKAAQIADSRLGDYESRQRSNQIYAEIEPWAIQHGADGKHVQEFNPQTGQYEPAFTPLGNLYSQMANHAYRNFGVRDPQALHDYAMSQVELAKAKMPTTPVAAAAPAAPMPVGQQYSLPGQPAFPVAPNRIAPPGNVTVPVAVAGPPQTVPTRLLMRQAAMAQGMIPATAQ